MRGIVIEIRNGRCVVLKDDGTFTDLPGRGYQVGQQITIQVKKSPLLRYAALAACLLLVCLSGFGVHLYRTPASYIYLDINPSVRLDLNCFERVIAVVPLNEDAKTLLSAAEITRRDAQSCINQIVAACQEQRYLNETNTDIELSVCTDDASVETAVETVTTELQEQALEVTVFQMEESENTDALERHISAKRLRAVRAYTEAFGGTLDENMAALQGISSDDIHKKVHAVQRQDPPAAETPEEAASEQEPEQPAQTTDTTDVPTQEQPEAAQRPKPLKQDEPESEHTLPESRLRAIRAYTDVFGGTPEENTAVLKGVGSKEIYEMIDAELARREESQKEGTDNETNFE